MNRDDFYATVGANIRSVRKQRRKAQKELAAHLGLSRESISNIEKGRHAIQLHVLVETAKYLNVDVVELLPSEVTARAATSARDRFAARVMRVGS